MNGFSVLIFVIIGSIIAASIYNIFFYAPSIVNTYATYTGTVKAAYVNDTTASITFTTNQTWIGNITKLSNLSIGSICTLIQNTTRAAIMNDMHKRFINGTCKAN